ncbi:hypothetical protein CYMTET_52036 [Cymbomonas tetramitiformis]|uniref:Uncharacterized protein n=1 Tax=Cymbomonas tetramitiformis TaxID=36881 RepID=A0AAE0BL45_9CHLO|nr:hypothetical protein CYMTET_52036 [Cymbomonas tetramitiformis]
MRVRMMLKLISNTPEYLVLLDFLEDVLGDLGVETLLTEIFAELPKIFLSSSRRRNLGRVAQKRASNDMNTTPANDTAAAGKSWGTMAQDPK